MISFFKVFLKANLWKDFISSLDEFQMVVADDCRSRKVVIVERWSL